jgi:hypothetical protein
LSRIDHPASGRMSLIATIEKGNDDDELQIDIGDEKAGKG